MPYDGQIADFAPQTETKTRPIGPSVVDVLRAARRLIDTPEKWCQFSRRMDGAHCVLGAVDAALGVKKAADFRDDGTARYWRPIWLAAGSPSHDLGANWALADWNNAPERTHAEVMAAFSRAISLAEHS